jgi:hypothetical protein
LGGSRHGSEEPNAEHRGEEAEEDVTHGLVLCSGTGASSGAHLTPCRRSPGKVKTF